MVLVEFLGDRRIFLRNMDGFQLYFLACGHIRLIEIKIIKFYIIG